ncbi:MAG: hypothetical protein ACXVZX_09440 [Terriglobales bacterium]
MKEAVKPARTYPEKSSLMSLVSGWLQQGFENFIATQRILVELAMRQNANAINAIQKRLSDKKVCPVAIVSEFAGDGISNFIEAQKVLLSLAQRENEIIMNGMKERVGVSSVLSAMTDFFRRSVDNFLEMQHGFLKIASKQTQNWLESAKNGKPYDSAVLMTVAQEGMENFVRWQKKFLDIVAEETSNGVSGKARETAHKMKKTQVATLAKEVTEEFIEAQKKLLDVAGKQVEVNVKTADRTVGMLKPFPFVPFADLTREGVRTFVDAEKGLIDTMMKKSTKATIKPKGRGKPAARKATKRTPHMTQAAVAD